MAAAADGHVGRNVRVIINAAIMADDGANIKDAVFADDGISIDGREMKEDGTFADLGAGGNICARVNDSLGLAASGEEQFVFLATDGAVADGDDETKRFGQRKISGAKNVEAAKRIHAGMIVQNSGRLEVGQTRGFDDALCMTAGAEDVKGSIHWAHIGMLGVGGQIQRPEEISHG